MSTTAAREQQGAAAVLPLPEGHVAAEGEGQLGVRVDVGLQDGARVQREEQEGRACRLGVWALLSAGWCAQGGEAVPCAAPRPTQHPSRACHGQAQGIVGRDQAERAPRRRAGLHRGEGIDERTHACEDWAVNVRRTASGVARERRGGCGWAARLRCLRAAAGRSTIPTRVVGEGRGRQEQGEADEGWQEGLQGHPGRHACRRVRDGSWCTWELGRNTRGLASLADRG